MAGSKSDYLENIILNLVLRNTAYTPATTLYLGLYTTLPTDSATGSSGGVAVSGGSYARAVVTFAVASGGATSNSNQVTFPAATAGWGTVVGFGVFDALTSGNLLYWGDLTVSKTVNTGNQLIFPIGSIQITEG